MRKLALLSLSLLGALAFVGCGGGDDDDTQQSAATGGAGGLAAGASGGSTTGGGGGAAGSSTGGRTGGSAGTATGGGQAGGTVTAGYAGAETGGTETAGAAGAESGGAESGGAESGGAESGGAESGGAESGGAESGGAESGGAESGGAESGGAESGGAETGGAAPGGAGGEATGGAATAGAGGEATGGAATAGAGGEATGGAATAGAGGEATGGVATAGASGAGGAAASIIFDFETDVQGWTSTGTGVSVAVSTAEKLTGSQALAITLPALTSTAADADAGTTKTCDGRRITVDPPGNLNLWPGAVVTLHVWVPTAVGGLMLAAFSQTNGWVWDSLRNSGNNTLVAGGWNTWTYTLPENTPGGLQQLGIQAQACDGWNFAGGTIYLDSITVSGGTGTCAGTATRSYGWETVGSVDGWTVNNAPADTVLSESTAQGYTGAGTGSLQVAFTNLTPGTSTVSRQIMLNWPKVYCGQTVTYHVWVPTGFADAGMNVQAFATVNNYDVANSALGPSVAPTENAWTTITLAVPQAVDTRGVNRIGLQFNLLSTATAAYTGNVYIDSVAW